jgi:hypothetical protein
MANASALPKVSEMDGPESKKRKVNAGPPNPEREATVQALMDAGAKDSKAKAAGVPSRKPAAGGETAAAAQGSGAGQPQMDGLKRSSRNKAAARVQG